MKRLLILGMLLTAIVFILSNSFLIVSTFKVIMVILALAFIAWIVL